ncbi:MAG: hypothetical protein JW950_06295 [Deltaproteobacteria bacterium]|nr:hypothetical protein [Deltaproteobacteria bacterium]
MKGRFFPLVAVLAFLPFLLAMGVLSGESSPDKIPTPAKKFTATFIDQTDVITECIDVSIEGGTFIEGKRGEGTYAIPFENIQSIRLQRTEDKLKGLVTLRDGSTLDLSLSKNQKAYGRTQYGTFQIRLEDLKKMIIAEGPKKRK